LVQADVAEQKRAIFELQEYKNSELREYFENDQYLVSRE
jgi:hypothetical protein